MYLKIWVHNLCANTEANRHKNEHVKAGRTNLARKMEMEIAAGHIARKIGPDVRGKLARDEFHNCIYKLENAGLVASVEIPTMVYIDFWAVNVKFQISEKMYELAADLARVWPDAPGGESKAFGLTHPELWLLFRDRLHFGSGVDATEEHESLQDKVKEKLIEVMLGDQFCDIIAEPTIDAAVGLANEVLKGWSGVEHRKGLLETVPEYIIEPMDDIMCAAKVIVALSDSEPGRYNSTYAEVLQLLGGGQQQMKPHLRFLRTAILQSKSFMPLVAKYWGGASKDDLISKDYTAAKTIYGAAKFNMEKWASTDAITLAGNIIQWRGMAREGGLARLMETLVTFMAEVWFPYLNKQEPAEVKDLDALLTLASAVDPNSSLEKVEEIKKKTGAKKLRQTKNVAVSHLNELYQARLQLQSLLLSFL